MFFFPSSAYLLLFCVLFTSPSFGRLGHTRYRCMFLSTVFGLSFQNSLIHAKTLTKFIVFILFIYNGMSVNRFRLRFSFYNSLPVFITKYLKNNNTNALIH